jgi:low temperature requirement protein LtrA
VTIPVAASVPDSPPPTAESAGALAGGRSVGSGLEPELDGRGGDVAGEERLTSPVELLWDLVFVFAVTQVTTLLLRHLSWAGFGRSMLVLALVWWAWSAFVWAANAQDAASPTLRATLLLALLPVFIAGLTIPSAFGADATLFATAYAVVRFMHLALYADASRRGQASWNAIAGFASTVAAGMALLILGSFLDESARLTLWTVAVAIDYAGPAWLTRERLRGLQRVAIAHFAERYGSFVIICLGESIVEIGIGANGRPINAALVATVASGVLITIGLWWTYFYRFAGTASQRLRDHHDPVIAAADAYSYLHLVLVAGIIVLAVGLRLATQHAGAPLGQPARLALCGGVALYLTGHVGFRRRLLGSIAYEKLIAAGVLLILVALGGRLSAWSVAIAVSAVLVVLCTIETITNRPEANAPGDSDAPAIGGLISEPAGKQPTST